MADIQPHTSWCRGHHGPLGPCRLVIGTAGALVVGLEDRPDGRPLLRILDSTTETAVETDSADGPTLRDLISKAIARLEGVR